MKQLACEVCGSTDLTKKDGAFVCMTCGCKYTVEEVRKMMRDGPIKVTGTVKVDNSAAIDNYLDMARNAVTTGNNKEAENYCNKIIEIKSDHWEAWFIKGKAVGWMSTLGNVRTTETISAFSKALEYCPEERKGELCEECKAELDDLNTAMLCTRMNSFKNHPGNLQLQGLQNDIIILISSIHEFWVKMNDYDDTKKVKYGRIINNGLSEAWQVVYNNYMGDDHHPNDFAWKWFLSEGDTIIAAFRLVLSFISTPSDNRERNELIIQMCENAIHCQECVRDSCSYQLDSLYLTAYGFETYCVNLQLTEQAKSLRNNDISGWKAKINEVRVKGAEEVEKAARIRRELYWATHTDEKTALDIEKSDLQSEKEQLIEKIESLSSERESVPAIKDLEAIQDQIYSLVQQRDSLGLFKNKQRKAIQAELDNLASKAADTQKMVDDQKNAVSERIEPLRLRLDEVYNRIEEIDSELNQDR